MEIILEFVLQAFFEFLLQIVGEVLFELGWRGVAEVFKRKPRQDPVLAFVGYALLGVIMGGLSLLFFPKHLVRDRSLHPVTLIVVPILAGFCMSALGAWRQNRGLSTIRLDSFSYGFVFAFGMALIRYLFAGK